MRYLYGKLDERYVKAIEDWKRYSPLSRYNFRLNAIVDCRTDFDEKALPIVFKVTPDTLINLCAKVVDFLPLPSVYQWNIENICRWLRKLGYPQYQNTFRENLINGHTLLLIDASALSAMNIKNFEHIRNIAYGIRMLFYFEMTKFGRSITLAPDFHYELYKLFRVKTGVKYEEICRTALWRRIQLLREKIPNYSHWELLERWLAMVQEPKYIERFAGIHRYNIYKCKQLERKVSIKKEEIFLKTCHCMPPCECYWTDEDIRKPWRFKCLPHLLPDDEFVLSCKGCISPCTCRWGYKKYMINHVLKCLMMAKPNKYITIITNLKKRKLKKFEKSKLEFQKYLNV